MRQLGPVTEPPLNYHNSKGRSLMRRTAAILLGTASLLPIIIKTVTALGALR